MEARAEARYVRGSAQKARLVIDLIRGQQAGKALTILQGVNKRFAPTIEKVLRSAIANAENKSNDVDVDALIVTGAYVNEGPRAKRVRPAPMGRAYRYQRRMSHIVVTVGPKPTGPWSPDPSTSNKKKVRRKAVAADSGEKKTTGQKK